MGAIDPRYPPLPRPVTIENATDDELDALTEADIDRLGTPHEGPCDWGFWARDEQLAPTGDWATWLYLAGRGAGKTRAGAEWVLDKVRTGTRIIHLVAPTEADYRDVMIHGPAGLVTIAKPNERPATSSKTARCCSLTVPMRSVSRPSSLNVCAARNARRHGATRSRHGAMSIRPGT